VIWYRLKKAYSSPAWRDRMPIPKRDEKFCYEQYMTWPDDERWEIIDGNAYDMTPAPSFKHQRIVGSIYRIISNSLHGHDCVPGIAPTDVMLSDSDVVQPDIFI
jgi:hypothetical protein